MIAEVVNSMASHKEDTDECDGGCVACVVSHFAISVGPPWTLLLVVRLALPHLVISLHFDLFDLFSHGVMYNSPPSFPILLYIYCLC